MSRRARPNLPTPPAGVGAQLRSMLSGLREQILVWRGDVGDRRQQVVTFGDLDGTDVGRVIFGAAGPTIQSRQQSRQEIVVPVALTNLSASALFQSVILTWDGVEQRDYVHTEVWRNTQDDLGTAKIRGTAIAGIFTDDGDTGQSYYYWVRAVTDGGGKGPFNDTAGTFASPGTIGNSDLGTEIVAAQNLANAAVDDSKIADLAVSAAKLADSAVESTKIANAAVGNAAIANAAVGSAAIQNLAVGNAAIQDLAVDGAKIANLAVESAKIANLTVGTQKIEDLAVTAPYTASEDTTVTLDSSSDSGVWKPAANLSFFASESQWHIIFGVGADQVIGSTVSSSTVVMRILITNNSTGNTTTPGGYYNRVIFVSTTASVKITTGGAGTLGVDYAPTTGDFYTVEVQYRWDSSDPDDADTKAFKLGSFIYLIELKK